MSFFIFRFSSIEYFLGINVMVTQLKVVLEQNYLVLLSYVLQA